MDMLSMYKETDRLVTVVVVCISLLTRDREANRRRGQVRPGESGEIDLGKIVTSLTKEYGASQGSRGPCHCNDGGYEPFGLPIISPGVLDLCQQSKLSEKTSALRPWHHNLARINAWIGSRFLVVFALF